MELRNLTDDEKMLVAQFRLCREADREELLRHLNGVVSETELPKDNDGE